jgi:hypothetical protein
VAAGAVAGATDGNGGRGITADAPPSGRAKLAHPH